jgi:hypothetical protein
MAAHCLRARIAAVPYTIQTVLTANGTPFTELAHLRRGAAQQQAAQQPEGLSLIHAYEDACERHGIKHRLTTPGHPRAKGQSERMNRPCKMPPANVRTPKATSP